MYSIMLQVYNTVIHNFSSLYAIYGYKILACVVQYILVAYFIPNTLYLLLLPSFIVAPASPSPQETSSLFSVSVSLLLLVIFISWL